MKEAEAIDIANTFLKDQRRPSNFISARFEPAFTSPWQHEDQWVITYDKILPPDIDMDPSITVVRIECRTREAAFVEMM